MGKPMGGVFLGYPPETYAEPDNDGDYDCEESARELVICLGVPGGLGSIDADC